MLETKTDEGKTFKIFCMKEPDYVMELMASLITLNELRGDKTPSKVGRRIGRKRQNNFVRDNHLDYISNIGVKLTPITIACTCQCQ